MRTRSATALVLIGLLAAPPVLAAGTLRPKDGRGLMKKQDATEDRGGMTTQEPLAPVQPKPPTQRRPVGERSLGSKGGTGVLAPAGPGRSLQPTSPSERDQRAAPLGGNLMEKQRQIQFRPRIESLVYEPGTVGQVANGVLAPGGHVTLFGVHFGEQTGEIYMWGNESELGLPEGRLTTQVKEWADNRVRVAVRPNTLQGPLYRSSIWFRVVPPTREGSVPYKAPFEVPSEVRTLGDAAVAASVEAIECSDGANENHCDGSKVLATHENIMVPHNPFDPDGGVDRWRIRLFEGWTFRDSRLHVRSGHAELARKPSPGGSEWEGGVSWACSIQETAKYELDVKVQRPSRPRDPLGVEQLE